MTWKNPEDAKAYFKAYRAAHRAEIAANKKAYNVIYQSVNSARIAARKKAYRAAHQADMAARSRDYLRAKREGAASRPKPDVCEIPDCDGTYKISWDHDHTIGSFRAWLCNDCNRIVHGKMTAQRLRALADFLDWDENIDGYRAKHRHENLRYMR
jgi:Recombination endonuclease VII